MVQMLWYANAHQIPLQNSTHTRLLDFGRSFPFRLGMGPGHMLTIYMHYCLSWCARCYVHIDLLSCS